MQRPRGLQPLSLGLVGAGAAPDRLAQGVLHVHFCLLKERRGRATAVCSGLSAHRPPPATSSAHGGLPVQAEAFFTVLLPVFEGSSQGSGGADRGPLCSLSWAGMGVSSNAVAQEPPWISPNHTLEKLGFPATFCLSISLQCESKNTIKYPQACGPCGLALGSSPPVRAAGL